ncbi:MAG: IS110 family transposase [Chloroflexota bacterium]|nr:IS110 family transposase [Chloroflexota bacterium]
MDPPAAVPTRFVALDLHKDYIVVGAVDAQQHVVLPPRRIAAAAFEAWARTELTTSDAVVLEATTTAWQVHDLLVPLVASVTVAHPLMVKLIAAARVKTDRRDTINLAKLLAANLIPVVWVPPIEVRELRGLLAHRRRLVQQRTQLRNRLHSLLHRHHLVPPAGELFAAAQRPWWEALTLSPVERLRVQQDLQQHDQLTPLIAAVEAELARLSVVEPWAAQVPYLLQLPGIGLIAAMTLLAAIGDIARFPAAKHLVGYSGLGAGVHNSGQTHHGGPITKQGRREIRAVMVEAAWVAIARHPHWQREFQRLAPRIGRGKAVVAIARKLLVVVWYVLSGHVPDTHADAAAVARKYFTWGARYRLARQLGLSRALFTRQQLDQVGLGGTLEGVAYEGRTVRLPPAAPATLG